MLEVIGFFTVWAAGAIAVTVLPVWIGGSISDKRRDDGKAFFLSLPVALVLLIFYALLSAIMISF